MTEDIHRLIGWLENLADKHPAEWEMLPDIGLYMDQVQTYIDRQLGLYRRDEQDRLLSPAMINNYIKDNLIPRAEVKKYTPTHLALLVIIGTLKQVLSIPNLANLLSTCRDTDDVRILYGNYRDCQRKSLENIVLQVRDDMADLQISCPEEGSDINSALRRLALELSIEARTRILISEKILSLLAAPLKVPDDLPEKKKDKDKAKKPENEKAQ